MNRKQFIGLLFLVLVLGGAGLKFYQRNSASWSGGGATIGQKLLGEFAVNDVAQISVKQGTNELMLAKKNDLWRVRERGDYPAGFSEISSLLLKLKDLKVVQTEAVGPSQLPRLELEAGGTNPPTSVEFRDAGGKVIKSLLLGKKHMKTGGPRSPMEDGGDGGGWPDGRYVLAGGAADRVALISDALANLEPNAEPWLNKDFFKVEKARTIAVTFQNATNSWKLARETEGAELKLADTKPGEVLDSGKASGVASPFSSPSFADVAVGVKPEQAGLDKPTTVSVETVDGFTYTIKVGAKTNENYFLTMAVTAVLPKERTPGKDEKPEDKTKLDKEFAEKLKKLEEKLAQEKTFEPWTYLVAGWTVDSILKERAQLFVEKKDETKKDAATKEEPAPDEKPADEKK
jgi:hypothetical protein